MMRCQITSKSDRNRSWVMANPCLSFEHKIIRPLLQWRAGSKSTEVWLLACSGGMDSLVLAEVLWRWQRALKIQLQIAYVHHGHASSVRQNRYRDRAQRFLKKWCHQHEVCFFTNSSRSELKLRTEDEFRHFRRQHLKKWAQQANYVVFAHHRDDLFETRLLRLIRGTGQNGLKAMSAKSGKVLRPMLECSRVEIESYAQLKKINPCEDPSNRQTGNSLRNWLRHDWIPALEKRQQGASAAMARSLEMLSRQPLQEKAAISLEGNVGLRREDVERMPSHEKEELIASYLRQLGLRNYGRSHVLEILKRLDTRQKNLTFEMLGVVFRVTPDLLWASRV